METKDELKRALMQEAEAGVLKLLEQLQRLPEGDLKGLEHQMMDRRWKRRCPCCWKPGPSRPLSPCEIWCSSP